MGVVSFEVRGDIAVLTIANPPLNVLSQAVRAGLLEAVKRVDADPAVKVAVLVGHGRTFIAGADIKEFDQAPMSPLLPDVINRMESSSTVWIAAIHGSALGGGLEVALACHYRVVDVDATLGFPEVNLGLIPGAGGTIRLPRLIDCRQALGMISGAKPVRAQPALESGLVDQLVSGALLPAALEFAGSVINQTRPTAISLRQPVNAVKGEQWGAIIEKIESKARGQCSPVEAAKAIQDALEKPLSEAFKAERDRFIHLKSSQQAQALRYIFLAEKSVSKTPKELKVDPLSINIVGVVGGGTMGAGIAAAMLLADCRVVLIERDKCLLEGGIDRVKSYLDNSLQRGLVDRCKHSKMLTDLWGECDYSALADADLVIEAVFEEMEVKLEVLAKIDAVTKVQAIIASNTSYLDVNHLARSLKDPSRVVGLHFFSPAHVMKLLEIIKTDSISPEVIASCFVLAKRLKKIAVLAGMCDGFIGNRIMSAYRKECEYMLEEGAMPNEIDEAMIAFGYPMGIFAMQDLAGLDIAWAMRKRQATTRDPNTRYTCIADRLCEMGRFGRKTNAGWYRYDPDSQLPKTDDDVQRIICEESEKKGIERKPLSSGLIINRILDAMQNEAAKVLSEGIADSPEAIDTVMVNGYGFPRWRGGPMYMQAELDN